MTRQFHTMIALVSDQRMQNLIPLFQKDVRIERVILVVSKRGTGRNPIYVQAAEDLIQAISVSELAAKPVVEIAEKGIAPFDILSARVYLEKLLTDCGPESALVNLTGGTKTMSIGAYAALQNKKATAVYVDSANEKLIWLDANNQLSAERFNLQPITVATALTAHGRYINEKKTKSEGPSMVQLEFMHGCLGHLSDLIRFVDAVKNEIKPTNSEWPKIVPVSSLLMKKPIKIAIERSGLIQQAGNQAVFDDKAGSFFFGGKWLEVFVYVALQESGLFDDTRINISLTGLENELDVLCTYHGRLAIIECKSGQVLANVKKGGRRAKQRRKEQQKAILNRMRVLKDFVGGAFAQAFIATPVLHREILDSIRQRAEEYRVTEILTRGKLGQVEKHVYRSLSAKL